MLVLALVVVVVHHSLQLADDAHLYVYHSRCAAFEGSAAAKLVQFASCQWPRRASLDDADFAGSGRAARPRPRLLGDGLLPAVPASSPAFSDYIKRLNLDNLVQPRKRATEHVELP